MTKLQKLPIRVSDLSWEIDPGEDHLEGFYLRRSKPSFDNGQSASVLHRKEWITCGDIIYEIWASDKDDPEYPFDEEQANEELARIQALPCLLLEDHTDSKASDSSEEGGK